ncbi:hypothetical protein ENUP19_0020G0025 [Entamoeba nuttalli]
MKMSQSPYLEQVPSPVNFVLRSPNCSLEKLLELPDILTELRINKRLQKFISGEHVLDQLFDYIRGTGDERFQSPATQIVCSEIMTISENIFYFPHLINSLFKEISQSEDEITISCISRVLSVLMNLPTSNVFEIMSQTPNVINVLMNKINNYEVSQFILSIMKYSSNDELGKATGAYWLCQNGFVSDLLKLFVVSESNGDNDKIESITSLIEEITLLKESSFIFNNYLNSNENLSSFYSIIFNTRSLYVFEKGLCIIQNILACCVYSGDLCINPYNELPMVYQEICKYFEQISYHFKYENGPITQVRIQLVHLLLSLTLSNYSYIYNLIIKYKLMNILLDIFFNFNHNCTIFRQIAFDIISFIINQSVEPLKSTLLEIGLLKRLVEEDKKSIQFKNQFNYYPDHHSLTIILMSNIHLVAEDDPSDETHNDLFMSQFEEYYNKHILPRETILTNHYLCEIIPGDSKENEGYIFDFFDDEM